MSLCSILHCSLGLSASLWCSREKKILIMRHLKLMVDPAYSSEGQPDLTKVNRTTLLSLIMESGWLILGLLLAINSLPWTQCRTTMGGPLMCQRTTRVYFKSPMYGHWTAGVFRLAPQFSHIYRVRGKKRSGNDLQPCFQELCYCLQDIPPNESMCCRTHLNKSYWDPKFGKCYLTLSYLFSPSPKLLWLQAPVSWTELWLNITCCPLVNSTTTSRLKS